jgi:hypothetical protein
MMGSFGLLQRLVIPAGKPSATGGNTGIGLLVMMGIFVPQMMAGGGPGWLDKPWTGGPIGLLTPIPALVGLFGHEPWRYGLSLFDVHVPFLVVTPLSQLIIAGLCIHTMERRLVNPITPPVGKREAYLTLMLIDVLIAGMFYGAGPYTWPFNVRVTAFCVVHLLASFWLMVCVTPGRDVLETWIWRWRGRRSLALDWWIGDRTENALVLLTFGIIGFAATWLAVALPDWSSRTPADPAIIATATGVSFLLLLAYGTVHQWFMLVARRQGFAVFLLFVIVVNAVPAVLGTIWYEYAVEKSGVRYDQTGLTKISDRVPSNVVLDITPGAHFAYWFGADVPRPRLLVLVPVYGALLVGMWLLLRGRVARMENVVDRKLEAMGVRPVPI